MNNKIFAVDMDLEQLLNNIGIKIKYFNIFKKSTYKILKEISKKWKYLDKDIKDEITKLIMED